MKPFSRHHFFKSMLLLAVVAFTSLSVGSSCTPANLAMLLDAVSKAAKVSRVIADVVDEVDQAQQIYFDRHPSMEAEQDVQSALSGTREAVALLNKAIEGSDEAKVADAREVALGKYGDLRRVLDERGILSGSPPLGGSETDSPVPEPFDMPTVDEVSASAE